MDLLKVGQNLNIYFEKDNNIVEITCNVKKIFDDRIVIELPQYFMRYINYLEVGCPLTVKVFSKVGTLNFNTVVISSPLEDEFAVELDYNAMKINASESLPVISAVETLNITKNEELCTVKTFEISTEYIKFYGNRIFQVGDELNCELVLPKLYGNIKFKGQVTEIDPVYDNEFTINLFNMNENDRQNLLYYMYVYENTSKQA